MINVQGISNYYILINRYRSSKEERAVKVYTIAQESNYLVIRNISAIGVGEELIQLLASYGTILEYRYLYDVPAAPYTEVMWVKFKDIQSAMYRIIFINIIMYRDAKVKMNKTSFYGLDLFIMYGPEYESVNETLEKLEYRRKSVHQRIITNKLEEGESIKGIKPINLKPIKPIAESENKEVKSLLLLPEQSSPLLPSPTSQISEEKKEEIKDDLINTTVEETIADKVRQKLHSLKKKAEEDTKMQIQQMEPKKKRKRI